MKLTVGAVQMESRNGDVKGNLLRAIPLVKHAAELGARLICLPELLPSGYIFDRTAWDAAEDSNGPTVQWLAELAGQLNATIGTSFLERFREGFRNTFVLMGPDGEYGRVYKRDLSIFEKFITEGVEGSHAIDTPMGRIGVGICFENFRAFLSRDLAENNVDILLQPHSCPDISRYFPSSIGSRLRNNVFNTARLYAVGLGIPSVFANKCGQFRSPAPIIPYMSIRAPFLGHSAIVDSNGNVLCRAEQETGILVETVVLDPDRKTGRPLPANGDWVVQVPLLFLWLSELIGWAGQRSYARNKQRILAVQSAKPEN